MEVIEAAGLVLALGLGWGSPDENNCTIEKSAGCAPLDQGCEV